MKTLRNQCLAVLLLVGLVAFAIPADAVAGGVTINSLVKTGASGQAYVWSPGGC